ncbi:hypothetical protein ACFX10_022616 [Malus domestica]
MKSTKISSTSIANNLNCRVLAIKQQLPSSSPLSSKRRTGSIDIRGAATEALAVPGRPGWFNRSNNNNQLHHRREKISDREAFDFLTVTWSRKQTITKPHQDAFIWERQRCPR